MRTIVIHRSLHKKTLVMGGDRELVMLSALISIVLAVGGMTIVSASVALFFWITTVFILQKMAKEDPLLFPVFLRHRKQQDFYPAKSTPWIK